MTLVAPLDVGELYACPKHFLLLFSDEIFDSSVTPDSAKTADFASTLTDYWSRHFEKPVTHCAPGEPLLVVRTLGRYTEVLAGNKRGWFDNQDRFKIRKLREKGAKR